TPMSRAQALRLMSRAIVGAVVASWAPRTLEAANCANTTCPQTAPDLCCIDFPTNPNASISTCCKVTERCCSFVTPQGGAFASVTCCGPTQHCKELPAPMQAAFCEDCPPGSSPCGSEPCCSSGQSCVNGTCVAGCTFTDDPLIPGTTPI